MAGIVLLGGERHNAGAATNVVGSISFEVAASRVAVARVAFTAKMAASREVALGDGEKCTGIMLDSHGFDCGDGDKLNLSGRPEPPAGWRQLSVGTPLSAGWLV